MDATNAPTGAQIRAMLARGMSNHEVRMALEVTRSRVAGVRFRMLNGSRRKAMNKPEPPPPPPPTVTSRRARGVTLPDRITEPAWGGPLEELVDYSEDVVVEPGEGVTVLDVGFCQCRYIVSEVDQKRFCAAPTPGPTKSYCADHHKLVWVKITRTGEHEARRMRSRR